MTVALVVKKAKSYYAWGTAGGRGGGGGKKGHPPYVP